MEIEVYTLKWKAEDKRVGIRQEKRARQVNLIRFFIHPHVLELCKHMM